MSKSKHISYNDLPQAVEDLQGMVLDLITEVRGLKKQTQITPPDTLLTREEVAEYFKCNPSTVHNWTKRGKLTKFCICNRTYYKKSQVEAALIKIE